MLFLRRIGLFFTASLLPLLLVVFAFLLSTHMVFGSPAALKEALRGSDIYSALMPGIIREIPARDFQVGSVLVNDSVGHEALQRTLTPAYVQQLNESQLDGLYAWAQGKTQHLELGLTKEEIEPAYVANLITVIQQRTAQLPLCPSETSSVNTTNEILQAACRPRHISVEQLNTVIQQEVTNAAQSTPQPETGKQDDLEKNLAALPRIREAVVRSLVFLPIGIVLSGLALVFWSSTRRKGLRRVSFILIGSGMVTMLTAVAGLWALGKGGEALSGQQPALETAQDNIAQAVSLLAGDLRAWWVGLALAYVVLGIVGLLIARHFYSQTLQHVMTEEKALGHNTDIPQAGTTFSSSESPTAQDRQNKK